MHGKFVSRLSLHGQAVIVLGAGAGMGAETCRALADAGAGLICVDRDAELAEKIAAETGGIAVVEDVTSRSGMQNIAAAATKRYGAAVKGLVDIVGIASIGALDAFDDTRFQDQIDIVLRHAFLAIQICAPLIAENGGGAMTFIGSNSGMKSVPGQVIYGTAKAALHHLVRCSAREYAARGLRMNIVAPGFIRTPRLLAKLGDDFWNRVDQSIPMQRAATTEDVASAVLFLQSDLAAYVTGNVLMLDGGTDAVAAIPTP